MGSRAMLDQRLQNPQMWGISKLGDTALTNATRLPWDVLIHAVPSQKWRRVGSLSSLAYQLLSMLPLSLTFQDACSMSPATWQQDDISAGLTGSWRWPSLLQISALHLFNCHFHICKSLFNNSCPKYSIPLTHAMPPLGFPNSLSSRWLISAIHTLHYSVWDKAVSRAFQRASLYQCDENILCAAHRQHSLLLLLLESQQFKQLLPVSISMHIYHKHQQPASCRSGPKPNPYSLPVSLF